MSTTVGSGGLSFGGGSGYWTCSPFCVLDKVAGPHEGLLDVTVSQVLAVRYTDLDENDTHSLHSILREGPGRFQNFSFEVDWKGKQICCYIERLDRNGLSIYLVCRRFRPTKRRLTN